VKLLFLDSESEVAFAVATLKSLVGETIAFVFGGGEIVDTDTGSALFGLLDLDISLVDRLRVGSSGGAICITVCHLGINL